MTILDSTINDLPVNASELTIDQDHTIILAERSVERMGSKMQERRAVAHQLLNHWYEDVLQDEEAPDGKTSITQDLKESLDQVDDLLISQI